MPSRFATKLDELKYYQQMMTDYMIGATWNGELQVPSGKLVYDVFLENYMDHDENFADNKANYEALYQNSPALKSWFNQLATYDPLRYFEKFPDSTQKLGGILSGNLKGTVTEQQLSNIFSPQDSIDAHSFGNCLRQKEQNRTRKYETALKSLKNKAYHPVLPGTSILNTGGPELTMQELRAAAYVVTGGSLKAEDCRFNPSIAAKKILDQESMITNLATDPVFCGYVQEVLIPNPYTKNGLDDIKQFVKGWNKYQENVAREFGEIPDKMADTPFFSSEGICITRDKIETIVLDADEPDNKSVIDNSFDSELFMEELDEELPEYDTGKKLNLKLDTKKELNLKFNQENTEHDDSLEILGEDDYDIPDHQFTKEEETEYNNRKNKLVENVKQFKEQSCINNALYSYIQPMKAVNMIVAGMLTDPYTADNFLGKNAGCYSIVTGFDENKLNRKIDQIRSQLIADPVFKKVLSTNPLPGSIYEKYKKAVRSEVNKRNAMQISRDADRKHHPEEEKSRRNHEQKIKVVIPEDVKQQISDTYETLMRVNKGKEPSNEMRRLMKALKAVRGKDKTTFGVLDEVNRAALAYHDARKGIFFEPFTENGKLRLQTVENLIRKTDNCLEMQRKRVDQSVKQEKLSLPKEIKL